jgi:citrate lyase subunit beta/citryl-CoA lyase
MGSSACDARASSGAPRSLLFVPGDSEKKLARALDAGADALILDLEDSVAAERKATARGLVAEFLSAHGFKGGAKDRSKEGAKDGSKQSSKQSSTEGAKEVSPALWVRINAPASAFIDEDLTAVVALRPRGLLVPKVRAAELGPLAASLDALERRHGLDHGAIWLLPTATETPASLFSMGDYAASGHRLAALTWGAEDLSAALGAATAVGEGGAWLPVYELARSLCLLAAAAAGGVAAIDTVYTDFRDADGLRRQALEAHRDGFSGKLAIHPDQIEIIHAAFRPSAAEIDAARSVVAAFERAGNGVASVGGRMLDQPHLRRARRLLARAAHLGSD